VLQRDAPAVRARDRLDDREPEAEGAAAVAAAAHEAVEERGGEGGVDTGAVVFDDEQHLAALRGGAHADVGARRGVAQGVLDQVDREAVQFIARALQRGGVDVERDRVVLAHGAELGGRLDDDLGEVNVRAGDLLGAVAAGEQEQVGNQAAHAL